MDKDLAFIRINEIFFAIKNEDKLPTWQLAQLREVLKQLQDDVYQRGVSRGINDCIELLKSAKKE